MKALDLFCCAGGASRGLADAGFEVTGIDITEQPHYPYTFIQSNVLDVSADYVASFDLVWASPPCQQFTAYRRKNPTTIGAGALNLIPQTRDLLARARARNPRLGTIIENVPGAPLEVTVMLCGSMFELDVRRHRIFECSFPVMQPRCTHHTQRPRFAPASNRTNLRSTVEVGVYRIPLSVQQRAMGISWMPLDRLSQAIPPSYAAHLARAFLGSEAP